MLSLKNKSLGIYHSALLLIALFAGVLSGFAPVEVLLLSFVAIFSLLTLFSFEKILVLLLFIRPALELFRNVYLPGPLEGILNPAGAVSIFFVAMGGVWLLGKGKRSIRDSLTIPSIIFLALALLSSAYSVNKMAAIGEWIRYLGYFFMYFLILNIVKTTALLKKMVFAITLSSLIPLAVGLWQIINHDFIVMIFGFSQIQSVFAHPNIFGIYLAILGPIIFLVALSNHSPIVRFIYFLMFGILVFCLMRTYSRVSWVGFFIGMSIVLYRDYRRYLIFIPIAATLFWALDPNIQSKWALIFTSTMKENSLVSRLYIWQDALNIFKQSPILGSGLRSFTILSDFFESKNHSAYQGSYAHNLYIQLLVEMGVLGLISYLSIQWNMLSIAMRALQNKSHPSLTPITVGFLSLFVSLSIMALVDNVLSTAALQWYLWAYAGMASCAWRVDNPLA